MSLFLEISGAVLWVNILVVGGLAGLIALVERRERRRALRNLTEWHVPSPRHPRRAAW